VLNGRSALLTVLDGLAAVRALQRARVPHPPTAYVGPGGTGLVSNETVPARAQIEPPLVLRPRVAGAGTVPLRCETKHDLARLIHERRPPWLVRNGGLVQGSLPRDALRIRTAVAGGAAVWAAVRRPGAMSAWRGVSSLPAAAANVAVAAADAVGADFVGVDLAAAGRSFVVLGFEAAVELTPGAGDRTFDALAALLLDAAERRAFSTAGMVVRNAETAMIRG
jgi:glutathione synthase/RimK-type ligase-like ATP-grasp enzyme